MTENKIDSVKIIHDDLQVEEYTIIGAFLRLIGVFVCNATYHDNRLEDDKFDLVVYIKNENSSEENLNKISSILGKKLCLIQGHSSSDNVGDDEYKKQIIQKLFSFINDSNYYLMQDDIDVWNKIFDIFLEYNFIKHRRFVYYREVDEFAQHAQSAFLKMMTSISGLSLKVQESGRRSRYINYATFYLAYLINECCSYLQQDFLFDSKILYDLIKQSANQYNDFENYYLLMAFLTELDSVLTLKGEHCYEMAVAKLKGVSYANYAYYRYGRYCEIVLKNDKKAREYYLKAYTANPREYRAIYKLGYFAIKDKHYEEATMCFRNILSLLEGKFEHNVLLEIEYEYYYKSCKALENIGKSTRDIQMADDYELKAEELLRKANANSSNLSYDISFMEETDKHREATYDRLRGRTMKNSLWKVRNAFNT